jgi:hypothetical protein
MTATPPEADTPEVAQPASFTRDDALLGQRDYRAPHDVADLAAGAPPIAWVQAAPGRWEGWASIGTPPVVIGEYQFIIEYRPDLYDLPRVDDPDNGCNQNGPWWIRWWYPPCAGINLPPFPTGVWFAHTLHNAQTICQAELAAEITRTRVTQPDPTNTGDNNQGDR